MVRLEAVAGAKEGSDGWTARVVGTVADGGLGCTDFDAALFDHFAARVKATHASHRSPMHRRRFP